MNQPEAHASAPSLDPPGRTALAAELMLAFTVRTAQPSGARGRRYLWTDAFAVCNHLALDRRTGDARFTERALQLIDLVHHELGQGRPDAPRRGWLGDASEAHPTRGGLRIGKPLPERARHEAVDPRLEWERDGQYFHYLVKWMHALDQAARATRLPLFNCWARELAEVAHRAFTYVGPAGRKHMIWKASIDLSRPLVASMGQHDPIDGWVTCVELDVTARALGGEGPDLMAAMTDFAVMIDPAALATDDPLGLGGLLMDAFRLEQLVSRGAPGLAAELVPVLLRAALAGLPRAARRLQRSGPAHGRLAFRELGLAIGLSAAELALRGPQGEAAGLWAEVARFAALRGEIEAFWALPEHRQALSWQEHRDISDVMLASCLVPEGLLVLHRGGAPPAP